MHVDNFTHAFPPLGGAAQSSKAASSHYDNKALLKSSSAELTSLKSRPLSNLKTFDSM